MRILIVDELHQVFKERASAMGYLVDDEPSFTRAMTLMAIKNYDGIAVRTKFKIDQELMEAAPNLKFIARAGAGLDNIDIAFAKERNIQLINASEGNCDAVGEHAMGMLLSLMNHLNKADHEVRTGIWDREGNRGYELSGKTVGVIGYGFMGQSFARKLRGFDVKVIVFDKYKSAISDEWVQQVSMEEMVKQADVLSLHIPLTAETRQMVDDEYLFHFKKPIFFINTARGEIVNTSAILKAIQNKKIIAAGLDVLEVEKFPALSATSFYESLVHSGKLLLSPHVAGWTFESYRKISEVLAAKLAQLKF